MYGQTDNGLYYVHFWEPIDTSEIELRIDEYVPIFPCLGIKLYGCVSSEGKYNVCHFCCAYSKCGQGYVYVPYNPLFVRKLISHFHEVLPIFYKQMT